MTREPAAIEQDVVRLNDVLEPMARERVDTSDPDYEEKLRAKPHPLDRAGVRPEAEALIGEMLTRYAEDDASRPGLRALYGRYRGFRWAVNPQFPATPEGIRSSLLLLSLRDQGDDTRDELLVLQDVCAEARGAGVDIDPILREVAAMSSDVDRYGMGSMRELFLRCAR